MAKITRTLQRRLVASSLAFILTAAIMMPTTTDARGGGGHHGGVRNIGILGFKQHHVSPAQPGFSVAFRSFHNSPRHAFSQRRIASRRSRVIGSDFFSLAPNGIWFDDAVAPTVVVVQEPAIAQEAAAPRPRAVVRTPGAEQDGVLVVRGNSKAYVTFAKPG